MEAIRKEIADLIGIDIRSSQSNISYTVLESVQEVGYLRKKITYDAFGDAVPAYLLIPDGARNAPAVLINHQHNSERHLGKSEVCGLAGSPYQAFGPQLARLGFVVLVLDVICFEERRKNARGTQPLPNDLDFWNHLNEMCYRLLRGECLMKKILEDTMSAVTLLSQLPMVDKARIGTLGHSMGGNTVQFLFALDERLSFACASGSACSYRNRMAHGVGIELASVIPNFYKKYDIGDLLACGAPRKLLIVSAEEDKYSRDAAEMVAIAKRAYAALNAEDNITHIRYPGGHPLTRERFDAIIKWLISAADSVGQDEKKD